MSETVSASGSQALDRQPRPKSRETDVDSLCGVYEMLYTFGLDPGESNKLAINEILSSPSSYAMTSCEACAWEPWSGGLGQSGRDATFKSTDGQFGAYVSLCYPFSPAKKCLVILLYSPPLSQFDHESHGHGEQQPTGVWIGMSSGGSSCPPVDR
jgi:hypothetical protein